MEKKIKIQSDIWASMAAAMPASTLMHKPGRRSNPIPDRPEEDDEEPIKPGKASPAKKKKKKSDYEVTY